ncbi:protein with role in RNA processing [Blyttiomyces sp. JEL0837]|nr:protein with role in RNA processing [Blyttiomyces sp. JEL0837]
MTLSGNEAVGQHVKIVLTNDAVYQGLIFAYEPSMGILALQSLPTAPTSSSASESNANSTSASASNTAAASSSSNGLPPNNQQQQKHDFHILKIASVKEVTRIKSAESTPPSVTAAGASGGAETDNHGANYSADLVPIGVVSMEKMLAREHAAVKAEIDRKMKIGVGVTAIAQEIFYALDKTLPTRWKGETIIVMDEVRISPPYTVEDVNGPATASAAVSRVKKVLELERRKLIK